jgi:hypothetical protein
MVKANNILAGAPPKNQHCKQEVKSLLCSAVAVKKNISLIINQ